MICVAISSAQAACVTQVERDDEEVAEAQQGIAVTNALIGNALIGNALIGNALIGNALIGNALIGNALIGNSLVEAALHDADAREVLRYVVSCALPATSHFDISIDGTTYGYTGALGLAPEWGRRHGVCNGTCQEWVSACVLARVNYLGEHVSISVRGAHPALRADCSEISAYPHREAAFYGNIFAEPQRRYACLPSRETLLPRVCGPTLDGCVIDVIGHCRDACSTSVANDGSYRNCADNVRHGSSGFPRGTDSYDGTVTVFLQ